MTTYPVQFLYIADQRGNAGEIINGARTAANITAWGDQRFSTVLSKAGCPVLALEPCTVAVTPPLTITTTDWLPADLTLTGAPWYDGSAESLEGVGLTVTDWTGLDGAHQSRSAEQYATQRGGAWFGPLSSAHRVWKLNVTIIGKTNRGCNYIFRWLEQQLFGCCGSEGSTAWFREYCPDISTPYEGLARAENVSLIEGLQWIDQPVADGGGFIRQATFALGVGDPCLYRNEGTSTTLAAATTTVAHTLASTLVGDALTGSPCQTWDPAVTSTLSVSKLIAKPRYGVASAVVTISSQVGGGYGTLYLPDMRIFGTVDRNGVGNLARCANSEVSQLLLSGVPAGVTVEVDMARKTIRQRGGRDDYDWLDATGYVKRVAGSRNKWASFSPCDVGTVHVEPFSRDQFFGNNYLSFAATWDVTIQDAVRFACPGSC